MKCIGEKRKRRKSKRKGKIVRKRIKDGEGRRGEKVEKNKEAAGGMKEAGENNLILILILDLGDKATAGYR